MFIYEVVIHEMVIQELSFTWKKGGPDKEPNSYMVILDTVYSHSMVALKSKVIPSVASFSWNFFLS